MMRSYLLLLSLLLSTASLAAELTQRLEDATKHTERVLTSLLATPGSTLTAADHLVMAQAYLTIDNKEAALESVNKAAAASSDPEFIARSLLLKARIYGILFRDTKMALQQLEQAKQLLQERRSTSSRQLYIEVLTNFAQGYNQLGQLATALNFAEQGLALAELLQEPARELAARILLGRLALQDNRYQYANQQLLQALELARQLEDEEALASIHFRLGMAYRKLDAHQQALVHLEQAAERYQALNRLSNYSYVLVYLAETHLEEPVDTEKAEQYLQQALMISQQTQDLMRTAIVNQSLGRIYQLRQQPAIAQQHYNIALQHFRQLSVRTYEQESSLALARLYMQQQQPQQAASLLEELAHDINTAAQYLQQRYYLLLAELAVNSGNWQQAYLMAEQAHELRFAELTSQLKEQLAGLNNSLTEASASQQQQQLLQDLEQQLALAQRQRGLFQLLLAVAILLGAALWWSSRLRAIKAVSLPLSRPEQQWSSFAQQVQLQSLHGKDPQLFAICLTNLTELKYRHGELMVEQLLNAIKQLILAEPDRQFLREDNVLWFSTKDQREAAAPLLRSVEQQRQTLLPDAKLLSMQLPLTMMLGSAWQPEELSPLRECLWLGGQLAQDHAEKASHWHLYYSCASARPCEWRSSNIRSDMKNALRLAELLLEINQQPLRLPLTEPV
ncbi:hypothetical protein [Arsukibacterium sp.]|uniref:hypothetical protein n=1 Tax=Arsukibacterium sp. TaxID=1977258 RepID=UPI002FD987B4